jgi:hypothetical protein
MPYNLYSGFVEEYLASLVSGQFDEIKKDKKDFVAHMRNKSFFLGLCELICCLYG